MHDDYLAMEAYPRLTAGLFTRQIILPRVQTSAGLALLLDRRIICASDEAVVADVFSEGAIVRLFAHYQAEVESLRSLIAIASVALADASSYGADVVDEIAIETAIADRPTG